ncbi:hypothetical protein L2E82_48050 [Cichorium intybus]|uniref:Uncharacterized protein n=1 Tax=Cichorium intybus TaxID=13427 RepID=A0ACB8YYG1_CICIN|nr:hypothetical protein L2E82_48050 [Cichorium intybus]
MTALGRRHSEEIQRYLDQLQFHRKNNMVLRKVNSKLVNDMTKIMDLPIDTVNRMNNFIVVVGDFLHKPTLDLRVEVMSKSMQQSFLKVYEKLDCLIISQQRCRDEVKPSKAKGGYKPKIATPSSETTKTVYEENPDQGGQNQESKFLQILVYCLLFFLKTSSPQQTPFVPSKTKGKRK